MRQAVICGAQWNQVENLPSINAQEYFSILFDPSGGVKQVAIIKYYMCAFFSGIAGMLSVIIVSGALIIALTSHQRAAAYILMTQ
jgi:hypothetical protein